MDFEARLINWTSTGREFLNYAEKLLVDLVDWLQNAMRLEGHCLRLKRKTGSMMIVYPDFVAV
jgi:hypothetical protein